MPDAPTIAAADNVPDPVPQLIDVDTDQFYTPGRVARAIIRSLVIAIIVALLIIAWIIAGGLLLSELRELSIAKELMSRSWVGILLSSVVTLVVIGGPLLIGYDWIVKTSEKRIIARAQSYLAQADSEDRSSNLTTVVGSAKRSWRGPESSLVQCAWGIVDAGLTGITVRACPASNAFEVETFPAPIEPIRLDRATIELGDFTYSDSSGEFAEQEEQEKMPPRRLFLRGIGGFAAVMRYLGMVVPILFLAGSIVRSVQDQRVTWGLVFWGSVIIFYFSFSNRFISAMREPNLLVVCGGLVWRPSHWLGLRRDLHLFGRQRSVLFVHQNLNGSWFFAIADDERKASGKMDQKGIDLLLRAWLSPVPPPELEKIGQLFGGDKAF